MSNNENTGQAQGSDYNPHVGESQPRRPNYNTGSKILNLISAGQAQTQNHPEEDKSVQGSEALKPAVMSLPTAPSGLSAHAPEFIPTAKRLQNQVIAGYGDATASNSFMGQNEQNYAGFPDYRASNSQQDLYLRGQEAAYLYELEGNDYLGNEFGELTLEDCDVYDSDASVEERFNSVLKILTSNPTNMEEYLKPICNTLGSMPAADDKVTSTIVENLYQQCILEENFRYTGARICLRLNSSLKSDPNFIKIFVNRCLDDFNKREQLIVGNAEDNKRLQGLSMLLAEIFCNLEESGSDDSSKHFLPSIIIKIVETLLSSTEDGNIKCACQLLKLSGSQIENTVKGNPQDCGTFEGLFVTFDNLLSSKLSENAKSYIQRLVDLKNSSWDRSMPSVAANNIYNPYAQFQPNEGPGGFYPDLDSDDGISHVLTEEEEQDFLAWKNAEFESDSKDLGMNNEMEEAFEEFLKEQPSSYSPEPSFNHQMLPPAHDPYHFHNRAPRANTHHNNFSQQGGAHPHHQQPGPHSHQNFSQFAHPHPNPRYSHHASRPSNPHNFPQQQQAHGNFNNYYQQDNFYPQQQQHQQQQQQVPQQPQQFMQNTRHPNNSYPFYSHPPPSFHPQEQPPQPPHNSNQNQNQHQDRFHWKKS